MPVIREYTQQGTAPGPINRPQYSADQFGAQSGRALENLGGAVSQVADTVAKRIDQQNTSDVTAKLTKAQADLAIDLQQTIRTAKPGDPKPFEEYDKRVEETIGKVGEDASTVSARAFFGEASVRMKGQFAQTSAAGQAELAGIKAVTDYSEGLNGLSSTVLADPSSAGLQRELHAKMIDNLVASGQLPASKGMELRKQGETALAKSTVRGWIDANPEYAKQKLKSGEFDKDLGAEGKVQLYGEVDQAIRAREIDQDRRIREQERVTKLKQQKTQNDFLAGMMEGKLDTKTILASNLEAFGSGSKDQFLDMLKKANSPEEKLKTDPTTMISLFNRINLPDGDPDKIIDENQLNQYFGNGLSMADLGRLRDEIQGSQTEMGRQENDMKKQVMEIAKGKLTRSNPLTGLRDPAGDEQMAKFQAWFFDEFKAQRAAGVPAKDLLTPGSEKYLGAQISTYTRTNQQIMRDLVPRKAPTTGGLALTPQTQQAGATPKYIAPPKAPPLPRQPGESPQAYLKRKKEGGG